MLNNHYLTATLVVVICFISGFQCGGPGREPEKKPKGSPIVIKQPTALCDCESDQRFKNQITHNYDLMLRILAESDCGCSQQVLAEYKNLLNKMKLGIVGIVDAYFQCDKRNPTDAILAAIDRYDSTRKSFRVYGRNAYNKLPPKCNAAIQLVRQLPYISAENTITSMLTCAKLKSQSKH